MPILPLTNIPVGADIFADSNILVYALTGRSRECQDFVRQFYTGRITAFASSDVISDVVHRLLIAEATERTGRLYNHRSLKSDPDLVRSLTTWKSKMTDLLRSPLVVEEVTIEAVRSLLTHIPATGLLGKDALIYGSMAKYGLTRIATNDADFERLGLTVYKPTDLSP